MNYTIKDDLYEANEGYVFKNKFNGYTCSIMKLANSDSIDNYDIVEGPMADDQIWDYVEDYIAGKISKAAFWELVKFKYPTHQIVFCTETALSTLTFEGSVTL